VATSATTAETSASSTEASETTPATAVGFFVERIGEQGSCSCHSQPVVLAILAQEEYTPCDDDQQGDAHRSQTFIHIIVSISE
jgi:hypothetical protein